MSVTTFTLEPVAPYRLDLTAWVLRRRSHNAMDCWAEGVYRRSLDVGGIPARVSVSQQGDQLLVRLETTGRSRVRGVLAESLLDRLLGLSSDLSSFYVFADGDPRLRTLCRKFRGAKPPRFPTVFEALLNGISCQQLTISVGITLLNRLAHRFGARAGEDQRVFPDPKEIAPASTQDLRSLGYSRSKAAAILDIARRVMEGRLDLEALRRRDNQDAMETLQAIPGIGPWTSGYVLLRGLGRLEVFPGGDVGALNNLADFLGLVRPRDDVRIRRVLESWRPYGGLIYFHLLLNRLSLDGLIDERNRSRGASPGGSPEKSIQGRCP